MIQYTRTANAGGLLELDGARILLDGVSQAADGGYLATTPELLERLHGTALDAMVFTHSHPDHFQPEFVRRYGAGRRLPRLMGPVAVAEALPGFPVTASPVKAGAVRIVAVPSRHIGAEYRDTPHCSFLLKGSALVWFMGDAAPAQWQDQRGMPKPDLLIVPFAYAATEAAWHITQSLAPGKILLTHLPAPEQDSEGLWRAADRVLEAGGLVPELGETYTIS